MAGKTQTTKRGAGFLTRQEIVKCKQVAESKSGIYSQRAAALLALHEGFTQKETAEKCKLTLTQISYLKTSFKAKRLAIFPADLSKIEQSSAKAESMVKEVVQKKVKKEKSKKTKKTDEKKSKKKSGKKDKKDKKKKSKKDKKKKK